MSIPYRLGESLIFAQFENPNKVNIPCFNLTGFGKDLYDLAPSYKRQESYEQEFIAFLRSIGATTLGLSACRGLGAADESTATPAQTALPRWRGFNLTNFFQAFSNGEQGQGWVSEDDYRWISDWGLTFGGGFKPVIHGRTFIAEVRYTNGLKKIIDDPRDYRLKNQVLSFTLGVGL